MRLGRLTLLIALVLAARLAQGGGPSSGSGSGPRAQTSSVPTAALAFDGTLWVVWVDGRQVYAASSKDAGKTFGPSARVNVQPEAIDATGEARPKIAVGPKEEVYVSYTRKGEKPFTGDIRFSRRLPDGSFSEPLSVNDDGLARRDIGSTRWRCPRTATCASCGSTSATWSGRRRRASPTREPRSIRP
jgi:hypothetical protein